MRRVGIDTGGTFTDLLLLADGRLTALKVPSSPDDPARAALEGLRRIGPAPRDWVHGTTVGTNALLERRGARTALVIPEGFEDLLDLARQARPRIYDLQPRPAPPLVPPELRFPIDERTLADGSVERSPSPAGLRQLRTAIAARGVEAVAICLLHSYRNPAGERAVKAALEPLGLPVSASHEVLPEYREYERLVATVVNAYLRPRLEGYLGRLQSHGGGRLRVMRSNGGSLSAAAAGRFPVQTVLSGPAGGVAAAEHLARLAGDQRILTFDMGGTSTDVCLVSGRATLAHGLVLDGLPLRVPALDIQSVGAGGGSVAWVDGGGALRVGPRSAGADPGPACYGRGTEATVTDANLVLGRLVPERFLGGTLRLDPARGGAAVAALGQRLGLTPQRAALGVAELAEATMERALRVVSLQRGHDPSRFVLYCFGGAGGLHAARLARGLGIRRVRVPMHPGLFSALGMLVSDVRVDLVATVLVPASDPLPPEIRRRFQEMESQVREAMAEEGFGEAEVRLAHAADLRYRGQSYELTLPYGPGLVEAFHRAHRERYGHGGPDRPVEVVNLRIRASGRVPAPEWPRLAAGGADPSPALAGRRTVLLDDGVAAEVPVLDRDGLLAGMEMDGPAVVVEYSATTWLPAGWRLRVDPWGSLLLEDVR